MHCIQVELDVTEPLETLEDPDDTVDWVEDISQHAAIVKPVVALAFCNEFEKDSFEKPGDRLNTHSPSDTLEYSLSELHSQLQEVTGGLHLSQFPEVLAESLHVSDNEHPPKPWEPCHEPVSFDVLESPLPESSRKRLSALESLFSSLFQEEVSVTAPFQPAHCQCCSLF